MYRFTSTSKPDGNGKTFLQREETETIEGQMRENEWKEVNQMKITIKKPKGVACGVYLPPNDSGKPYHSNYNSDQREVLLPAGTCFEVLEKSVSNRDTQISQYIQIPKQIKMKLKCLGVPRNYFRTPTLYVSKHLSNE